MTEPYIPFPLPLTLRRLLFIVTMYAINFAMMAYKWPHVPYGWFFLMVGAVMSQAVIVTTFLLIPAKRFFLPPWKPRETLFGYFYWLCVLALYWHPIISLPMWYFCKGIDAVVETLW